MTRVELYLGNSQPPFDSEKFHYNFDITFDQDEGLFKLDQCQLMKIPHCLDGKFEPFRPSATSIVIRSAAFDDQHFKLDRIVKLDLSSNLLTSFLDRAIIEAMPSLNSLLYVGNQLKNIDNDALEALAKMDRLTSLDLSGNLLKEFPVGVCKILSLEILNLEYNKLVGAIPEELTKMRALMSESFDPAWMDVIQVIQDFRSGASWKIGSCKSISFSELRESYQLYKATKKEPSRITDKQLSEALAFFSKTGEIQVHDENVVLNESISTEKYGNLRNIFVRGNHFSIPNQEQIEAEEEIERWSWDFKRRCLKQVSTSVGFEYICRNLGLLHEELAGVCNTVKVVLVGDEGAGKSTLARNLIAGFRKSRSPVVSRNNSPEDCKDCFASSSRCACCDTSTVGVDIHECSVALENGQDISMKLWDFAGQRVYHSVHECFFTYNALYLLVWNTKHVDKVDSEGLSHNLSPVSYISI